MKRIIITLSSVLLLLALCVSCSMEQEDPNKAYPFDGKEYSDPTPNASVLIGTYLVGDYQVTNFLGYDKKYFVSIYSDGSFLITPQSGPVSAINQAPTTGTWLLDGSTMTITVFGSSIAGTKYDVEDAGFALKKNSNEGLVFAKLSDSFINTSPFNTRKLEGLFMRVDSYGAKSGYRFLSDGTVWYYSTDKKSSKGTYKISTNGTMLNINDSTVEYNYALVGNYLFVGGAIYKKVD